MPRYNPNKVGLAPGLSCAHGGAMLAKLKDLYNQYRKEITRFMKFLVVGTIGAIVDFSILNLLHGVLGWPLVPSNTVSFTCAVLSNFLWNRFWTYPDSRSKPLSSQLVTFFVVNLAGWAINTGMLLLLTNPMTDLAGRLLASTDPAVLDRYGYNSAKVIATGVVLVWNFFINRIWTYNDAK
ncbi:MAG: GtrA family protein [Anaerolineales bacterium]|nr:MAG: GtrA family protein [Anaerolineales bacterium]